MKLSYIRPCALNLRREVNWNCGLMNDGRMIEPSYPENSSCLDKLKICVSTKGSQKVTALLHHFFSSQVFKCNTLIDISATYDDSDKRTKDIILKHHLLSKLIFINCLNLIEYFHHILLANTHDLLMPSPIIMLSSIMVRLKLRISIFGQYTDFCLPLTYTPWRW